MDVAVDKTRKDGPPLKVGELPLLSVKPPDFLIRSGGNDLSL
jgi:hypothetical protein